MEISVHLSTAQCDAIRSVDSAHTIGQVVQTHVDTWLAPVVAQLDHDDCSRVSQAYRTADHDQRAKVRKVLNVGDA